MKADIVKMQNRFKTFYFMGFAGVGIFIPYLGLYLTRKNITGGQIGLLLGLVPLVQIFSQPLWGGLADVSKRRKQILAFTLFAMGGFTALLEVIQGFGPILVVIILYAVFGAPFVPISNAMALDYLEEQGQQDDFGKLRLWGSVGFVVTSFAAGAFFLDSRMNLLPYLFCGLMALTGLVALYLPDLPRQERVDWMDGLKLLPKHPTLAKFFLGMAFAGGVISIVVQYLPIYLDELKTIGWIVGATSAFQAVLEIPFMFRSQKIIGKVGLRKALLVGILFLPLRTFLYLIVQNPFIILFVQLLHSITIFSMVVVGAIYVSRMLPAEWRATGQSLYSMAYGALGSSIGLFISGFLYDWKGIQAVWVFCTLFSALGLLIIWQTLFMDKREQVAGA